MFDEPTNQIRAEWAQAALDTFAAITRMDTAGEETETILGDLLANFMHLCHQQNLDFVCLLGAGRTHFEAEIAEAGDELPSWAHSFDSVGG